jgi:phosphatidyl-myo-inositol dimannoside synthase
MKICIVAPSAESHSGIGRVVLNTGLAFSQKGHEVGYVTERGDTEAMSTLILRFNTRSPYLFVKNLIRMIQFVRSYDAILCLDVLPVGFLTALTATLLRKPFYVHCIGTYSLFSRSRIKNYFIAQVYRRATKIFVLSRATKQSILDTNPNFSLAESAIIPPGVQTDFFYPETVRSNHTPFRYCLTVGGVKSRKGHDVSLEAFGMIAKDYPDLHYVIVGRYDRTSEFKAVLDAIIEKYDIEERVHFLEDPSDEELRKIYTYAEFFVMTSRTTREFVEGFGIVYLEAGLCGIPSIGARESGAEDAIVDGTTGILVPLSPQATGDAMRKLLEDTQYRKRLAHEATIFAQGFTWEHVAECYLNQILPLSKRNKKTPSGV